MRLSISRASLLVALNSAQKAIAPKNPYPIMANFKLDLNSKGLEITGSNSDVTIRSTVPYTQGDKPIITNYIAGSALIDAFRLTEAVRKMEGSNVDIDVIDNSIAKISDSSFSMKAKSISSDEYPDIVLDLVGQTFEIGKDEFCSLIEQCAHAASTSGKTRDPVLTAINFTLKDKTLTAISTDTARVAVKKVPVESDLTFSANIPAKSLLDIAPLFDNAKTIRISIGDKQAIFSFDNTIISCRLIPGSYPSLANAFPKTFNHVLQVNSREFMNAIGRVSVVSNDTGSVLKLHMSEDLVELSIKNRENGSANEQITNYRYTGETIEVAINSVLVADAIKALKSEDVELCFYAEMRPFVVKSPDDDSATELITPVHVY